MAHAGWKWFILISHRPPPLVPTRLVKSSCALARHPLMTAGPCFQTAAPTTRFLSLRLEPRCNCDPARAASLPGGRKARPALGPRPPKWRTWEPRAARSSQHPPPNSTPASSLPPLRILLVFFRVPQLACAMAQHFSFPLLFLVFSGLVLL